MEEKYSLKVIQNGQTTLARQVRSGAGANGQAMVVKAQDVAATYQLVNPVTLTSPAKLQFKRKGDDLQISLPGGDSDMPDLVIQNYFGVEGNAVKGVSQNGEWMAYDTSLFVPKPVASGDKPVKALNPDSPAAVALGEAPLSALVKFDSPMGLAAIGGGALALGTMGKGGGSGTPTPTNNTDALSVIKSYAGAASGTVEPSSAQYTAAGVTLPTVDGVTTANVLTALNRVVSGKQPSEVSSKTQVQALADAMKSSWALIIAEANGSTADATPDSAPTAADYLNVGVTVGSTTKALALMNSALGQLPSSSVNTAAGIKDLATAADNVMKLAAGTSASVSKTDLLNLGLKLNGANSGITNEQATAFTANLANLETSLGKNDVLKTGDAVDTYDELQALFSLQVLRSYNDDTAAVKTQPAPGVADYTNIGIKWYANLSDLSAKTNSVALDYKNFGLSSESVLAGALNSALDNQVSGTALSKTVLQNMVDSYYKVLKEAGTTVSSSGSYVNDNSNNPLASDYSNLGITHSSGAKAALTATDTSLLSLMNDAVGRANVAAVDTATELQALEKAAENILAIGAGSGTGTTTTGVTYTSDADWLSGFSLLGVTGVTATNLSAIKTAIDAKDSSNNGTAIDTVQELQAIVSMYRINDYADNNNTNPLPTLADYQAVLLGQSGKLTDAVNANLSAYNSVVVNTPDGANHNTFNDAQVKSLVLSYNTILNFADGSGTSYLSPAPSQTDFTNIGVGNGLSTGLKTSVNTMLGIPEYANLLADVIGGKNASQVNTVSQLNDLATIIERISELESKTSSDANKYTSITGGPLSVEDFDKLGLDTSKLKDTSGTTLQNRLNYIYDNLIKVGDVSGYTLESFDTVIELNALIKASANIYPG